MRVTIAFIDRNPRGLAYDFGVPDGPPHHLTDPRDAGRSAEIADAQLDALLVRIATMTERLRGSSRDEILRASERQLLSDLAAVTAHLRARTARMTVALTASFDARPRKHP